MNVTVSCNVLSRWAQLVSRIVIFRSNDPNLEEWKLKLKLHQLWRIPVWFGHDFSKAMNFKLQLVFLRIMWVVGHFFMCRSTWSLPCEQRPFDLPADLSRKIERPLLAGYMITFGVFQSDWRKCNPIKSSKVNGDGKKHRSVPEVWSNAFIK